MKTIKIIGSQQTYIAWCHKFEKELNDVSKAECNDKFVYGCATCKKLEPLYLIHEIPIAMHA